MNVAVKKAFTLVELLIVIAIISILVVILFPVFVHVREEAGTMTCVSNLKQIARALMEYQQDDDARFPLHFDIPNYNGFDVTPNFSGSDAFLHSWPGILRPYSRGVQIWRCPDDPVWQDGKTSPMSLDTGSYWTNAYLDGWCNSHTMNFCGLTACDAPPLLASGIAYPATTVVMGDGKSGSFLSTLSMWCEVWADGPICDLPSRRHSGGGNYLFVDGHVKCLQPEAFQSTALDSSWMAVEKASCWFAYPHNDGVHPWFKP